MEVHEPIKRDRNLNITVIADDSHRGYAAVSHGIMLAEVFQASLTVMANFGFGFGPSDFRHIPDDSPYLQEIRKKVAEVANCQIITDYIFPANRDCRLGYGGNPTVRIRTRNWP